MALRKEYLILLMCIVFPIKNIYAENITEKFQIIVSEKPATNENNSTQQNKTIDTLVHEQTELIKKIISNHKGTTIDYPIVTKKEVEIKIDTRTKEEKEQESIEELRRRCHELFKLKESDKTENIAERSETQQISTVQPFGPTRRPEFFQKPKIEANSSPNFQYPSQVEQSSKKYFLITRNPTTDSQVKVTPKPQELVSQPQIIQSPSNQNIKYVPLEPIILQKLMLSNGRMLYYWYKTIPMIPQYVPVAKYQPQVSYRGSNIDTNFKYPSEFGNTITYRHQTQPSYPSYIQTYPQNFQISNVSETMNNQNHAVTKNQINPPNLALPTIHQSYLPQVHNQNYYPPTINQNYLSSLYNYNHLPTNNQNSPPTLPNQNQAVAINSQNYPPPASTQNNPPPTSTQHYQPQVITVPVRPPTTQAPPEEVPNYEIEYGSTKKTEEEDNLKKQMKFVIPVPYPAGDGFAVAPRPPWEFDPFAYYPKPLQPSTINVPLPYVPTFHMIRTLRIPDNLIKSATGVNIQNN